MKKLRNVLSAALLVLASGGATAWAAILTTPGTDFRAADTTNPSTIGYAFTAAVNNGTTDATLVGGIKRNPASAADGSQTVTIEGNNPAGSTFSGVIWAANNTILASKVFNVSASGNFSKTVTFTAAQAPSTVFFAGTMYMPPNSVLGGAYTN